MICPIFKYAFTFAHGSYTNGEISAQTKEEAMAKIERSCANDEPDYRFGRWLIIREKTATPPLAEVVKGILKEDALETPEVQLHGQWFPADQVPAHTDRRQGQVEIQITPCAGRKAAADRIISLLDDIRESDPDSFTRIMAAAQKGTVRSYSGDTHEKKTV